MKQNKTICELCGLEFDDSDDITSNNLWSINKCGKCLFIRRINDFVSEYSRAHKELVWKNKIYEQNFLKDNIDLGPGITSYALADHETSYRVEKRTKRVCAVIDKINYIRDYLYFNLSPIFKILDSIYIKKDAFWAETGNFLRYVHNCCFQEAVLKLHELLTTASCKYSVRKIINTLLADSKYVFNEQKVFERIEFKESKDVVEERYQPFDINGLIELIDAALKENKTVLDAMKDYRDNRFAHINFLKNGKSSESITYSNIKRMFSLAKSIYDAFLYVVAPDKYATIITEPNIWFSHMNEMTRVYKKHIEDIKTK